jgi:uncharacterized phage protein (TIGR02218 family)
MLELIRPLQSLLQVRVHRFATLYRITRKDGVVFRFTNHDATINYATHDYVPAGGPSASARQKVDGLKDRNFEAMGMLTSSKITFDDLRAGRYREAKVEIMTIDWMHPWADPYEICTYWITNVQFTGEIWTAQLEGLTHKLKQEVGGIVGRMCRVHRFGDMQCGVAGGEAAFTTSGLAVTSVIRARREFTCTSLNSQADGYYQNGYVRFTTGGNDNLSMDVNAFFQSGGRVVFWMDMPYDIQVGDTFNIVAGCDRLMSTCRDKFDNILNFRGYPTVPGTDAMITTPDSKL